MVFEHANYYRAHLLSDLHPYSCISESCDSEDQLFDSREQWIAHELENHHQEWWCYFPHNSENIPIFFSEDDFTRHIQEQHSKTLTTGNLKFLVLRARRASLYPFTECPFCEMDGIKLEKDNVVTYEHVKASKKLQHHIATNLENIAALAFLNDDQHNNLRSKTDNKFEGKAKQTGDSEVFGDVMSHSSTPGSRFVLSENSPETSSNTSDGPRLLRSAATAGNLEEVKRLVKERNVDVHSKSSFGETALHHAARFGNLEIVIWLAEKGDADVNSKNNYGATALHHAAMYGTLDVVKWLVEEGGAGVNSKNNYGETALHLAAGLERLEVVKWLVEEGDADINSKNNYDETALHLAAVVGKLEVVKWLVEEGNAYVNSKTILGDTALHLAAMFGMLKVVKWLVAKGRADINARTKDDLTAEQGAAVLEMWEVANWLRVRK